MMIQNGATFVDHYVDDSITVGAPKSTECANNFQIMHCTCDTAGAPVKRKNQRGQQQPYYL